MAEVKYSIVGKENSEKKKPSKFIPTKKMIYSFLAIFVIGAFFNLSTFPLMKFMSMSALNEGILFEVGWPKIFTTIDLLNSTATTMNWLNLSLNAILFLFLAYLIDVLLNFFLELDFIKRVFGNDKEKISEKPKIIG